MIELDRCMCAIVLLISAMFVSLSTTGGILSTGGVPKRNISFYLYTRRNPTQPQRFFPGRSMQMHQTHFDDKKSILILTHGFLNSAESASCIIVRDAYLKYVDGNVIIVDWTKITGNYDYWKTAEKVQFMGKYLARVIDYLSWRANLNVSKTILAGHSLGAHVMGIAGYHSRGTIKRIIGFDPASPMFNFSPPGKRISTVDAEYVQIIHTSAGFLGLMEPVGHADFYPNGGKSQPGCLFDVTGNCSHGRSFEFFAESMNPRQRFRANLCASMDQMKNRQCTQTNSVMGGIDSKPRGIYYLETNPTSPYARG